MGSIVFGGTQFSPKELGAGAAFYVAGLNTKDQEEQLDAIYSIIVLAGIDWEEWSDAAFNADETMLEMVGQILELWSARPWRTTVMLSSTTVNQWHTIRGRLIQKGIPDPLRQIRTLNALLDAVEAMLMEAAAGQGEKELRELERQLYPPPAVGEKPKGNWSDDALLDMFPEG